MEKFSEDLEESYLVVGKEAGFFRVLPGFSAPACGGVDLVPIGVAQGEGPSVGRHADDELVLGGAEFHPEFRGVVHAELPPPFAVGAGGVERGVVARFAFPFSVEVVGHQVDEVQVGGDGRDVVSCLDVVGTDGDGRGEQQSRLLHFLRLRLEGFSQFCDNNKQLLAPVSQLD